WSENMVYKQKELQIPLKIQTAALQFLRDQKAIPSKKNFGPFLDLCVSSLRKGHANLLCIVPILSDVPERTMYS
ncbi:hypothetical protein Tco_0896522, partial [Tanacetum coccineum]